MLHYIVSLGPLYWNLGLFGVETNWVIHWGLGLGLDNNDNNNQLTITHHKIVSAQSKNLDLGFFLLGFEWDPMGLGDSDLGLKQSKVTSPAVR